MRRVLAGLTAATLLATTAAAAPAAATSAKADGARTHAATKVKPVVAKPAKAKPAAKKAPRAVASKTRAPKARAAPLKARARRTAPSVSRPHVHAAPRFSAFIEDLPIMPGLKESPSGYAFEMAPGGRLAEARLVGRAPPSVIRAFYASTLQQLGWRPAASDPYVYRRGRERLLLHVEPRRRHRGDKLPKTADADHSLEAVFVLTPDTGLATARPTKGLKPAGSKAKPPRTSAARR